MCELGGIVCGVAYERERFCRLKKSVLNLVALVGGEGERG